MNREIKYRAWLKAEKIMVTVEEINFYDETFAYIFDNYAEVEQEWIEEDIQNVELLQYTGLKDKTGKDIYEGDIIRYFSEVMSKKEWICSVEVIGATFAVRTGKKSYMDGSFLNRLSKDEKLEIIGNIYENPNLLEESK